MSNLKSATLLLLSIFLVSCLPSKVMIVPDAESFTVVPAGQGVVALQLIDTDVSIPLEWLRLAPKDVNESDENQFVQIEARRISDYGTHTYIGVVPAGQYSIAEFRGSDVQGQLILTRVVAGGLTAGTFRVESGRLTNLGALLNYAKPRGNLYQFLLARNGQFPEATQIIRDELGELAGSISNLDTPLRWDEDGIADERRELYLNVVQNPLSLSRWQKFGDELVVLSSTGGMLRANRSDDWVFDFVESDHSLLMIDRNASGDQVVCAEGPNLFSKPAIADEWVRVAVPDGADLIATRIDSAGRIYLVDRQQTSLVVYEGEGVAQPNWQATMVYRQKTGWLSAEQDRAAQELQAEAEAAAVSRKRPRVVGEIKNVAAALVGDDLIVIEKGKTYLVDPLTKRASELKTPKKFKKIAAAGDMFVATWESALVDDGAFRYHWANDLAGPWKQIKHKLDVCPGEAERSGQKTVCADGKSRKYRTHLLVAAPILASNKKMYAVMRLGGDRFSQDMILAESRDSGETWRKTSDNSEVFSRCRELFPGSSENELLIGCDATDGKIYSYDLQTTELTLQRAPADF